MVDERILTTTRKGHNGFNISYNDEQNFAKDLLKILPNDWVVSFDWLQFAFCDVQYIINKEKKLIKIIYHRNLLQWKNEVINEIKLKGGF